MARMATEATNKEHAMNTTEPTTIPELTAEIIRQADAHIDTIGEAVHRMIWSYASTATADANEAGAYARQAERHMAIAQDQMASGCNATMALNDASHFAQKAAQAYTEARDAFIVADRILKASMA